MTKFDVGDGEKSERTSAKIHVSMLPEGVPHAPRGTLTKIALDLVLPP